MELQVNGDTKRFNETTAPHTITELLEQLGHNPKLVVIEFNGEILNPSKWTVQGLKNGDSLEIVTIVGGGS